MKGKLSTALIATMLLAAACSSKTSGAEPLEVVELTGTGDACVTHEAAAGGSACFTHVGNAIDVDLAGLVGGSTVTVEGVGSNTIQLFAHGDGTLVAQLNGQIVDGTFTTRGTWAGGEPLHITVRPAR